MEEIHEISCQEQSRKTDDAIWDCGSPLYDSSELASLSNLLERRLTASPFAVAVAVVPEDQPDQILEGGEGANSEERKVRIGKVERRRRRDKLRLLRAVFINAIAFWKRVCKVGSL